MSELVPVRAVERQRITRPDGEVVETERVVEFARVDEESTRAALPSPEPPPCDCGLCESALHLTRSAPARRALPPAPARCGWWRW